MSMTGPFRQKVRTVRIRCGINSFLRHAGATLAFGGGVAALAIGVQQLLAVPVLVAWVVWAFWGLVGAVVLCLCLRSLPSRMQASLLLDERLTLKERFSTTLAMAGRDDPFAKAACAESMRAIQGASLQGHFPVRLTRAWCYGLGTWAVAIGLLLYMPQKDLLGFLKQKQQQQEQAAELSTAKAEVEKAIEPLAARAQQLRDPALEESLKELASLSQVANPEEVKREAIKKLGDLSEKMKQTEAGAWMETGDMLQQMLKQLHGSTDPVTQQIVMSLAKGDYKQAGDVLRELQKQLSDGTLSEERRKELAAKLQQLGDELKKLSEQKSRLEAELEKQGLDKGLAQASPEELRKALQKQGLSPEQIESLVKKAEAEQETSICTGLLGTKLTETGDDGGKLTPDGLGGAIGELDTLESLQQQAIAMEANLDAISQCVGSLGEGLGQGMGQGKPDIGDGGGKGEGIGRATSETHEISSPALTANRVTRAATQAGNDPTVASWYFKDTKDPLVKGEAQRSFTEVVQAGRTSAAEAISDNQIPRRYEGAVKAYFDQLEAKGPRP